jgi:hypothetical protein
MQNYHIFNIEITKMLEKPEGAIKNRQFRDTGKIEHTIYRTKTNKTNKNINTAN